MKKEVFQRPELSKEQVERCHAIVDELVDLYNKTDPKHGKKSEKNKQEQAYLALNKAGELSGILTEWAENQLFGIYFQVAESKEEWIDQKTCNQHANETMWYTPDLPEDIFEGENKLIGERLAIGSILHNTFSRYGRMGWRLSLEQALHALNEGQVEWLLTPTNTGKKGNAYDLQELRWIAIKHLYKLIGEGWKKTAAENTVAESCGTSYEAIRKWEKACIKERDKDKKALKAIKFGSFFLHTQKTENPNFNEEHILAEAISWNMNAEKAGDEGHLKNLSFGIISAIMLDREMPLNTLGEKLSIAGIKQSSTK